MMELLVNSLIKTRGKEDEVRTVREGVRCVLTIF